MTTKKHVNVMGYLASNFVNINEKVPALIINPEATPLDLLGWCWGGDHQLAGVIGGIGKLGRSHRAGQAVRHFSAPYRAIGVRDAGGHGHAD